MGMGGGRSLTGDGCCLSPFGAEVLECLDGVVGGAGGAGVAGVCGVELGAEVVERAQNLCMRSTLHHCHLIGSDSRNRVRLLVRIVSVVLVGGGDDDLIQDIRMPYADEL